MPYPFLKSAQDVTEGDWILVTPESLPLQGRGPLKVIRVSGNGELLVSEYLETQDGQEPKVRYTHCASRQAVRYASSKPEVLHKISAFEAENEAHHKRLAQELRARFDANMQAFLSNGLTPDPVRADGLSREAGDVLPEVGSTVYILHGRDDEAHACTVTGYYAWPDLKKDPNLHRVFVRMVYQGTAIANARLLSDCYPSAEAALAVRQNETVLR